MGKSSSFQVDPRVAEAQMKMATLAEGQNQFWEENIAPALLDQMRKSATATESQAKASVAMQDYQRDLMERYDSRYWDTFAPIEDTLVSQAMAFNTNAERDTMARQAQADVMQQFSNTQAALSRDLSRRGVNPASGAALSLQTDSARASALASAGAMTQTREAARQLGWTRMGEAAALGRNMQGFGATSAQLSQGAGMQALNAGAMGMNAVTSANQASLGNLNSQLGAWNNIGGLGIQSSQLQLQNQQQQNAGIGNFIGGIGNLAMGIGVLRG